MDPVGLDAIGVVVRDPDMDPVGLDAIGVVRDPDPDDRDPDDRDIGVTVRFVLGRTALFERI